MSTTQRLPALAAQWLVRGAALGVSLKIWLTFSALILLFGLSGLVSYQYIGRIDNDLAQIVEVEEPLEQAVLEMEINASETALAVLGFIRDQDPAQLHIIRDSEADFRRFVGEFERLAETDEEQRLGLEVKRLFAEFESLGAEIIALASQRNADLMLLQGKTLEIDELIDNGLQTAIVRTAPNFVVKLEAALDMEINILEAFSAIEGYAARPNTALRDRIEDAEADFQRFEAHTARPNSPPTSGVGSTRSMEPSPRLYWPARESWP